MYWSENSHFCDPQLFCHCCSTWRLRSFQACQACSCNVRWENSAAINDPGHDWTIKNPWKSSSWKSGRFFFAIACSHPFATKSEHSEYHIDMFSGRLGSIYTNQCYWITDHARPQAVFSECLGGSSCNPRVCRGVVLFGEILELSPLAVWAYAHDAVLAEHGQFFL